MVLKVDCLVSCLHGAGGCWHGANGCLHGVQGALRLSMDCADAAGSKLILAHDPDADRLAVAEKQQDGEWRLFNGNEIALLFADWSWTNRKELHPDTTDDKFIMLASTVSSKALKAMAAHEGFQFDETLTGFKWLGNRAAECEVLGLVPLLAYEVTESAHLTAHAAWPHLGALVYTVH